MTSEIGFVGVGQMGAPMVERLLAAGHPVNLYARNPDVRAHIHGLGANIVDTLADVARLSDVVICCMFSDEQLLEVTLGAGGLVENLRPDSVLVSHTTGSLEVLEQIAVATRARQAELVEAPLSGTAETIRRGELTVMLAGNTQAIATARPALESYSKALLPTGPVGSAMKVKLINNMLFAANAQLVAESVRLGNELGLEQSVLLDALGHCSGNSYVAGRVAAAGSTDAFVQNAGRFLRKDVEVCTRTAGELGADTGLLGSVIASGPLPFDAAVELR